MVWLGTACRSLGPLIQERGVESKGRKKTKQTTTRNIKVNQRKIVTNRTSESQPVTYRFKTQICSIVFIRFTLDI